MVADPTRSLRAGPGSMLAVALSTRGPSRAEARPGPSAGALGAPQRSRARGPSQALPSPGGLSRARPGPSWTVPGLSWGLPIDLKQLAQITSVEARGQHPSLHCGALATGGQRGARFTGAAPRPEPKLRRPPVQKNPSPFSWTRPPGPCRYHPPVRQATHGIAVQLLRRPAPMFALPPWMAAVILGHG